MIPALAAQDVDAMRESVFFEGPEAGRKLTRFWILLLLAATIAAAGVVLAIPSSPTPNRVTPSWASARV